jgi:hypothetical protein
MRSRLTLFAPAVAAFVTIATPIPSSAQCSGLAEIWGNDQIVSLVESDTQIGPGLSFFSHGPVTYALWNESGTTPPPHTAGSIRWVFTAGTLMHELGHNLSLRHGGPVITSDNLEVLFVTSDNGRLYKLNAQTGGVLASVDTRRPICPDDRVLATPAVQLYNYSDAAFKAAMVSERGMPDDVVYVITATGCGDHTQNRVIAYYASNLAPRWQFNPTGFYAMDSARDGCEIDYGSNILYCGTDPATPGQNTLWAIQALSGTLVWAHNAGSILNRPQLSGGAAPELYVASSDGTIQKRNPFDGSLIWALPNAGAQIVRNIWPEFRSPLPTRIYYTTTDGLLHGAMDNFPAPVPLWPPISPGGGILYTTAPAVAPGSNALFVGRSDGYLQQVSLDGAAGATALVGRPGTVYDPSLDVSSSSAPDIDRLMVSTTEGTVKRFCIPLGSTTAVTGSNPVAGSFLGQNAPNPFSAHTRIDYRLPYNARVEVDVYDLDGHRVRTLVRDQQADGPHEAAWNGLDDAGRSVGSGFYIYRLRAVGPDGRSFEEAKKVLVVR